LRVSSATGGNSTDSVLTVNEVVRRRCALRRIHTGVRRHPFCVYDSRRSNRPFSPVLHSVGRQRFPSRSSTTISPRTILVTSRVARKSAGDSRDCLLLRVLWAAGGRISAFSPCLQWLVSSLQAATRRGWPDLARGPRAVDSACRSWILALRRWTRTSHGQRRPVTFGFGWASVLIVLCRSPALDLPPAMTALHASAATTA